MSRGQHYNGTSPLPSQFDRRSDGSQYQVRPGTSRLPSGPNASTFNLNTNRNEAPGDGMDEEMNTPGSTIIGTREAVRLQAEPQEGWHDSHEELSTDVPSSRLGPGRYQHGTLDTGSATTADVGMVRLPPKDNRADDAEEVIGSSDDDRHLPPQDPENLWFNDPDSERSQFNVVEQACKHAEQSSSTLTEEDFQRFMRQPLKARQQNLTIYFHNLAERMFVET